MNFVPNLEVSILQNGDLCVSRPTVCHFVDGVAVISGEGPTGDRKPPSKRAGGSNHNESSRKKSKQGREIDDLVRT